MLNGEEHDTIEMELHKPGPAIHSEKWDQCVKDVKSKNSGANAFAVCTAQLGEESFKSEYRHLSYTKSLINKARKGMGIGFAGPIPSSLLARQDLEGEEKEKSNTVAGDKLVELKDDAEVADTKKEKKSIASDIKNTQIKRQKATINMRQKSFKEYWKGINAEKAESWEEDEEAKLKVKETEEDER